MTTIETTEAPYQAAPLTVMTDISAQRPLAIVPEAAPQPTSRAVTPAPLVHRTRQHQDYVISVADLQEQIWLASMLEAGERARQAELFTPAPAPRCPAPAHNAPRTVLWTPPTAQATAGTPATGVGVKAKAMFTVWRYSDVVHYVPAEDDALLSSDQGNQVLWRDGDTALIVGPGGVGKSRLALQLAIAQILGLPWLDLITTGRPRKWLFMGNENSIRRMKADLVAMMSDKKPEQIAMVERYLLLHVMLNPEDADIELAPGVQGRSSNQAEPTALERWAATIAEWKPDILVIDPWEAALAGGDANDSAATRQTLVLLRRLLNQANPRASLLIIHHSREGAAAFRQAVGFDSSAFIKGTKSLRSMARFQINVAPASEDDPGRIVVSCGKSNNCVPFLTRGAVLDPASMTYAVDPCFDLDNWKEAMEGKQSGSGSTSADVWDLVNAGTTTTAGIKRALQVTFGDSTSTGSRRIKAAVQKRYIMRAERNGHFTVGLHRPPGKEQQPASVNLCQ